MSHRPYRPDSWLLIKASNVHSRDSSITNLIHLIGYRWHFCTYICRLQNLIMDIVWSWWYCCVGRRYSVNVFISTRHGEGNLSKTMQWWWRYIFFSSLDKVYWLRVRISPVCRSWTINLIRRIIQNEVSCCRTGRKQRKRAKQAVWSIYCLQRKMRCKDLPHPSKYYRFLEMEETHWKIKTCVVLRSDVENLKVLQSLCEEVQGNVKILYTTNPFTWSLSL